MKKLLLITFFLRGGISIVAQDNAVITFDKDAMMNINGVQVCNWENVERVQADKLEEVFAQLSKAGK